MKPGARRLLGWACRGGLGLLIFGSSAGFGAEQLPEWQDPSVVERNQEDTHVPIVPYAALEHALADRRLDSPFFQLLNGNWKFHWASTGTDVRWAALTGQDGMGLFVQGESLLNVSVQQFSTENLTRALYPFQLQPSDSFILNLDHRVRGVGGTPVRTLEKYRVLPRTYEYKVRLKPFSTRDISPTELGRTPFPEEARMGPSELKP